MAAATEAARLHIEGEAVANIEAAGVEGCWPGEAPGLLAQEGYRVISWPPHNLFFGGVHGVALGPEGSLRSEEHTSELQSLMRISYAVFCLKKKNSTDSSTMNNYN